MRALLFPILALAAALTPANATGAGAAFASLATRDAAACARACADDGLCMVWMWQPNGACELLAVIPLSAPNSSVAYGLSPRAPTFARLAHPPPQASPVADPAPLRLTTSEADATLVLLGGPDSDVLRQP